MTPVRYAAFMRALNVGGRIVKMDELKRLFAKAGFPKAESFIASGNIVFESAAKDAAAMERKIAATLHKHLGYEVATFLRTFAELDVIGGAMPFKGVEDAPLYYVGFMHAAPTAAMRKRLLALASNVNEFAFSAREVWWYSETPQSESVLSTNAIEKTLGVPVTFRNLRTVRKMVARWG
ncbi:MAG: DUF1697 domain-containing protein [Gemmatimonadetes bacterium]|nr:DUF1697 domain-containing protein [Gemmatimonadota bacterium]